MLRWLLVAAVLAVAPTAARAQVPNFVSVMGGGSFGLAGTAPSGLRVAVDYDRKMTELFWFGVGVRSTLVIVGHDSGGTIEPSVGMKFIIPVQAPVLPYLRADLAVIGMLERTCGDNGFAIAGRIGGGASWWVTRQVGIGLEGLFTGGPAFYGHCGGFFERTEFYFGIDVVGGVQLRF